MHYNPMSDLYYTQDDAEGITDKKISMLRELCDEYGVRGLLGVEIQLLDMAEECLKLRSEVEVLRKKEND